MKNSSVVVPRRSRGIWMLGLIFISLGAHALVNSTGQPIGALNNNGGGKFSGQFTWPTNPQNIAVRSNFGGSKSGAVTLQ